MSKIIAIMFLLCCGMMLFGCADDNGRRKAEQQKTIVVTDSVGRKVELRIRWKELLSVMFITQS